MLKEDFRVISMLTVDLKALVQECNGAYLIRYYYKLLKNNQIAVTNLPCPEKPVVAAFSERCVKFRQSVKMKKRSGMMISPNAFSKKEK